MNETEASLRIADALKNARGYGIDAVSIVRATSDPAPSSVIIVGISGVTLSVTVEILARP